MKMKTVAIADLKKNLFVRKELNHDHAIILGTLIENGVKLPPIRITEDNVVIDGRHRIEAYDLNKIIEIRCEVVDLSDEKSIIVEAFKANIGGSLPPTSGDIEHTMMLLLDRGESMASIAKLLRLPPGMARKYVQEVKSRMSRAKLLRAADAVTDGGLTVAKAAEQHNVDADKLKEMMSGHRKKHKQGIPEFQRRLTKLYKSVGQKNASLIRSLLEKYEDGDVLERQVRDIFGHIEQLQKQSARSVADWRKRFDAVNGKVAKSA